MKEKAIYFGNSEIYQKIRNIGGQWNDKKESPIVCLFESTEKKDLFWAIPVGNWSHRDDNAKARINKYLSYPESDIRSCFYHLGNTTVKSIFFISDVIPIIEKYIFSEYLGFDNKQYVIKNNKLIQCLEQKLKRILIFENSNKNYFRQSITTVKNLLIEELEEVEKIKELIYIIHNILLIKNRN